MRFVYLQWWAPRITKRRSVTWNHGWSISLKISWSFFAAEESNVVLDFSIKCPPNQMLIYQRYQRMWWLKFKSITQNLKIFNPNGFCSKILIKGKMLLEHSYVFGNLELNLWQLSSSLRGYHHEEVRVFPHRIQCYLLVFRRARKKKQMGRVHHPDMINLN